MLVSIYKLNTVKSKFHLHRILNFFQLFISINRVTKNYELCHSSRNQNSFRCKAFAYITLKLDFNIKTWFTTLTDKQNNNYINLYNEM